MRKGIGGENKRQYYRRGKVEATSPENMEFLYASLRSWGMEEEDDITFSEFKGFNEYRYPVDPTSLSANFAEKYIEKFSRGGIYKPSAQA